MYNCEMIKDITKECEVKIYRGSRCVTYKDVALFFTIYSEIVEGQQIYLELYTEDSFKEYSIKCKTPVFQGYGEYDTNLYGSWDTVEEANEWLENPKALY